MADTSTTEFGSRAPFVVAGHSHTFAFGFNPTATGGERALVCLPGLPHKAFGLVHPDGPYRDSYWDALVELSEDKPVALMWQGNQHLAEFLFAPKPLFDFVASSFADLPIADGALLVSEATIREYQSRFLLNLGSIIDRLGQTHERRIVALGTPPPKGSEAAFRASLVREPHFIELGKQLRVDLRDAPLTPPMILLKMWAVIQDLLRETAEQRNAHFLPSPEWARDPLGFLLEQYQAADVGHANSHYGQRFLNEIADFMMS